MSDIIKKSKNIPKPTSFGKNLKYLRRLRGISQTELASQLALKRNNIASYESSIVEPNVSNFLKICTYFAVSPSTMLSVNLAEQPIISGPENSESEYLQSKVDDFTKQTNEMTKIYEGYSALKELKKEEANSESNILEKTLDDLLDLLKNLIKNNWSLIQSLIPQKNQSDENHNRTN